MHHARAATAVAIIFACLSADGAASARPATSGADKGFTNGFEKNLAGDKGSNLNKHHERSSDACEDKMTSGGNERNAADNNARNDANTRKILKAETDVRRLRDGEVLVESDDRNDNRFVVARILINDTPVNVWRVLTNPFEFAGKISPRMKDVEILEDTVERSVMKCKMEVFPPLIPFISYTVESDYKLHEFVQFKRVAGSLKDFSGTWALAPRDAGQATEVTYSMHVDPGLPVPQWIIRKAMRMELPRTLIALRQRVTNFNATAIGAEPLKTILAVGPVDTIVRQERPVAPIFVAPRKSISKAKAIKPKQVSLRYDMVEN